jgi:class 3 adenylate cyclase
VSTENVAVLFTDVVGSTALAQHVSAETADDVRRGHFSVLRQAVAEAGGTEVKPASAARSWRPTSCA